MKLVNVVVLAALAVVWSDVAAQEGGTSPEARFEVSSVKPAEDRGMAGSYRPSRGQFTGQMTLRGFIALAYEVPDRRIVGPEWIRRDYFSITAKIPADAKPGDAPLQSVLDVGGGVWRPMLRHLLEERFALKVRRETQDMRVFALVKARSDGRLGPNLRQTSGCSTDASSNGSTCAISYGGPATPGVAGQMDWGTLNLAGILTTFMQSDVVDRTGLAGEFAFRVNWAYITPPLTIGDAPRPEGPSLFAALEEQLGLKLETATEPVEVLVIDAVSQPTPD